MILKLPASLPFILVASTTKLLVSFPGFVYSLQFQSPGGPAVGRVQNSVHDSAAWIAACQTVVFQGFCRSESQRLCTGIA